MAPTKAGIIHKIPADHSGPITNSVINWRSCIAVGQQHLRIRRWIILVSPGKPTRNGVLVGGLIVYLDVPLVHVEGRGSSIDSILLQAGASGCRIERGGKQCLRHKADHRARDYVVREWLARVRCGGGRRG